MLIRFFLLLSALSNKALSLPSTHKTVEQRSAYAWIGSFDNDDTNCTNDYLNQGPDAAELLNPRPELHRGKCVKFQPQGGRVGGIWGNGGRVKVNTIEAFMDDACKTSQVKITRKGHEDGFCQPFSDWDCDGGDVGNPCYWNSVKGSLI